MPRTTTNPMTPVYVTLDADCRRRLERIRDETPGIESISAAIRHAAAVAEARLDEQQQPKRKRR